MGIVMFNAEKLKLEMRQGSTYFQRHEWTLSASDLEELTLFDPVGNNNYGVRMQIREDWDSTDYLVSLDSEVSGIEIFEPEEDDSWHMAWEITIEATTTADFPVTTSSDKHKYNLEVYEIAGTYVQTLLYGDVVVNPEATK